MNIVYFFFPSLGFIPLGFISKVLIRHIRNGGHSRKSIVNKRFIPMVNDHIHEPNNLLNMNE